jgi:hypothetical protein
MAVSLNGDGTITGLSTLDSVTITGLTSLTTTDLTADTTTLVVDSANNRVGIGTSSPNVALEVGTYSTESEVKINSALNGGGISFKNFASNPIIELQRWSGTGTNYYGSQIFQNNTDLTFLTVQTAAAIGSQTFTERMRITSTGNVGIGTSNPSSILDVQATSGVSMFRLTATTGTNAVYSRYSNTGGYLYLGRDNSSGTDFGSPYASGIWSTGAYPMLFGTNGTERMRIASDGKVFIGTTSFTGKLNISQSAGDWVIVENSTFAGTQYFTSYRSSGTQIGTITGNGTNVSYNTSSDYRLKQNVAPMSNSIDRLKQLKPSTWSWTQDGSHGEGFLAHEAQTVVPESVTGTKDAVDDEGNPVYQGIDQSKLVPLLTSALQEAITKIEDLETRIQALENPS